MSANVNPRLDGVGKIAVLRAGGLGDFIFVLPALEALRAAYPEAEIVVLGRNWYCDFFAARPGPAHRYEPVPPEITLAAPHAGGETVDAFIEKMQSERFDLALQFHGGGRNSTPFLQSLDVGLLAGFRDWDAPALDRWVRYRVAHPEVLRYLEGVALVGAEPVGVEPSVVVTDEDRRAAADHRRDLGPYVVMNPNATDPRRHWPLEHFVATGRRFQEAGLTTVVVGGPGDEERGAALVAELGPGGVDLTARLSLGSLTGLLVGAELMISNDSGPLHLARAIGCPNVGIFWAINALTACFGPTARNRSLIDWQVNCPVCGADNMTMRCQHDPSFVSSVSVDAVVQEAVDLLAMSGRS